MNQQEFFERLLQALARLEIPYMITGSVGAFAYGEPRMTNDMDVVVELPAQKVDALAQEFPPGAFYFPPRDSILAEIRTRGQFNVIHVESGSKVDVILRKDTVFARIEFGRKRSLPFSRGFAADTASAEDIILSKLDFYRKGGSEKHMTDILGMLRVSGATLDLEYLREWSQALGLEDLWRSVQARLRSEPSP
ncbi:MAG: hypothetical protein HY721_29260 [Planctomycetes bacterium]|nr:hypothetical protein [Planctomycetota bacterium]